MTIFLFFILNSIIIITSVVKILSLPKYCETWDKGLTGKIDFD